MTKIVVLGAGIGGVPMAFELKELLGKKADITAVSQTEYFQFVPSNPWVAVNWRKPSDVKVNLPEVFKKLKIDFTSVGAKRVKPEANIVELNDGSTLSYDYLVIATGPHLAFDEVDPHSPDDACFPCTNSPIDA
jgi:sulfide:quinone oxidoreductase